MKDWNAIARAAGLDIPAKEAERNLQPLIGLDEAFRPLAKNLTPEMETAATFRADEEPA